MCKFVFLFADLSWWLANNLSSGRKWIQRVIYSLVLAAVIHGSDCVWNLLMACFRHLTVLTPLECHIETFQCSMEFCNKTLWNNICFASHSHICPERNYNDKPRLQSLSLSSIFMASPSKLLLFHHYLQEQHTDTDTKDKFHWSRWIWNISLIVR